MKRWHQDYTITLREWKRHRRIHVDSNKRWTQRDGSRVGISAYTVDCECDEQIGRFRKKDAYDCGITKCWVCHSDKFPVREKHRHELRADVSFAEQVAELWNQM